MDRKETTFLATSLLAVAAFLLSLTGCREEAKDQAKNTAGTIKANPKAPDADDAKIQEQRAKLSPEDRKLVDAQEWCVEETDERLGSMGVPIKLMVKDEPVFVCCAGCKRKALADPDATLAKVKELRAKKQAEFSSK
jgi:hypothetical protein